MQIWEQVEKSMQAVASMSSVRSEFGTLSWVGNWERRFNNEVQENKQEPRKTHLNWQLSLHPSILTEVDDLQERAIVVCHRAAHIPSPSCGKAEGGNVVEP